MLAHNISVLPISEKLMVCFAASTFALPLIELHPAHPNTLSFAVSKPRVGRNSVFVVSTAVPSTVTMSHSPLRSTAASVVFVAEQLQRAMAAAIIDIFFIAFDYLWERLSRTKPRKGAFKPN